MTTPVPIIQNQALLLVYSIGASRIGFRAATKSRKVEFFTIGDPAVIGINFEWHSDAGLLVALAPSLQLSGYGSTKRGATSMLDSVIADFIDNLLKESHGTRTAVLKNHGWRSAFYNRKFSEMFYHLAPKH